MIKLQITKYKNNENFEAEIKEYEEQNRYTKYANDQYRPEKTKIDNILEVEITQEQFESIRKAVLEKF